MRPMGNSLFNLVEREFFAYSYNVSKLASLVDQRSCLSVIRSPSELHERVDTGGGYSDPVGFWLERQEFLDEMIARYRLRVNPITHMLAFLNKTKPEMERLFELYYVRRNQWGFIESEMALSPSSRKRMRSDLVWYGARFLGFCDG